MAEVCYFFAFIITFGFTQLFQFEPEIFLKTIDARHLHKPVLP